MGPNLQHIQIDLQKSTAIYAILIWHYHGQPRVYHDVIVQISNDPEFVKEVHTVYNNDHDNSAGFGVGRDKAYVETNEGRLVKVDGLAGRYFRLYSNGNTTDAMNHYIEVEVFGLKAMKVGVTTRTLEDRYKWFLRKVFFSAKIEAYGRLNSLVEPAHPSRS
ncbi:hypothetical protein IIA15_05815, partial [candidate division TA06 bacterium]|nr:hypothetical protein [candidate division TA06 bacterium]